MTRHARVGCAVGACSTVYMVGAFSVYPCSVFHIQTSMTPEEERKAKAERAKKLVSLSRLQIDCMSDASFAARKAETREGRSRYVPRIESQGSADDHYRCIKQSVFRSRSLASRQYRCSPSRRSKGERQKAGRGRQKGECERCVGTHRHGEGNGGECGYTFVKLCHKIR